jgi:hypothetical protein
MAFAHQTGYRRHDYPLVAWFVGQCLIIWAPENKGNKDKLVCWSFVWVCTSLSGTTRRSQRKGLHMKDPILTGIRISSLVRGCNGSNKTNLCRMIAIGNYVQLLLVPVLSTDTPILSKIYLICVKIMLILDFTQYAHLRWFIESARSVWYNPPFSVLVTKLDLLLFCHLGAH